MEAPEWQSTVPLRPASNTQTGPFQSFADISASGQARQHNGNVYNNTSYNYTLRKRKSDDTLRHNERNRALLAAAAEGQKPRVSYLISLGADLDHSDDEGFTALHHACLSGFEDVVQVLLAAGADVNSQSLDLGTPLCLASLKNRKNVVDLLLDSRASVNKPGLWVGSPLHCASYAGALNVAKVLLEHGADMTSTCSVQPRLLEYGHLIGSVATREGLEESTENHSIRECHPFVLAVLQEQTDVVDHFISLDYPIDSQSREFSPENPAAEDFDSVDQEFKTSGLTPLMLAVWHNRNSATSLRLIRAGASLEEQTSGGQTALHCAVYRGDLGLAQTLITAGARLNLVDEWKQTPLSVATGWGYLAIVEYLVEAGAALEPQDIYSRTPLLLAFEERHIHVVKYLIERGVNVNAQLEGGKTACHLAAATGDIDILKKLIAAGAQLSKQDKRGTSPLHSAVLNGHLPIVKYMLERGANANAQDETGRTPSHMAAESGNLDVLKILHLAGAQLSPKDTYGATPLHHAVITSHSSVAEYLLDHGADPSAQMIVGDTPLHCAIRFRNGANPDMAIVNLLLACRIDATIRNKEGSTATEYVNESDVDLRKLLESYERSPEVVPARPMPTTAIRTPVSEGKTRARHGSMGMPEAR